MNTDHCQHCHARLKAVRVRDGGYDGQPDDDHKCQHLRSDLWCKLGDLPVPDTLQWLVIGASPAAPSGSTKSERVTAWAAGRNKPFTLEDVTRRVECSDGTVRKALAAAGYAYANRPRGGHFYRVYFPLSWTTAQCREWLDADTDSGKSKAKLYR
jgi:hypothetical protein